MKTRIPPPIVSLIFMVVMWQIVPFMDSDWARLTLPYSDVIALVLGMMGIVVIFLGILTFRKHETTVNPLKPETASRLVNSGIYGITRNPMYLGNVIVLLAWGIFLNNWPLLVAGSLLFVLFMNVFQIGPEEDALVGLFGDEYEAYRKRVRRWI